MAKRSIVKARIHHGAPSLDITIPSSLCKLCNINEGDAFVVDAICENNTVKIVYTRIYQQ